MAALASAASVCYRCHSTEPMNVKPMNAQPSSRAGNRHCRNLTAQPLFPLRR